MGGFSVCCVRGAAELERGAQVLGHVISWAAPDAPGAGAGSGGAARRERLAALAEDRLLAHVRLSCVDRPARGARPRRPSMLLSRGWRAATSPSLPY